MDRLERWGSFEKACLGSEQYKVFDLSMGEGEKSGKPCTSAVYHKFCTQFWQFEFLSEGQKSYVALAIRESLSITASKNRVYARCAFL